MPLRVKIIFGNVYLSSNGPNPVPWFFGTLQTACWPLKRCTDPKKTEDKYYYCDTHLIDDMLMIVWGWYPAFRIGAFLHTSFWKKKQKKLQNLQHEKFQRIIREAAIMLLLDHPHIVTLHEIQLIDKYYYFFFHDCYYTNFQKNTTSPHVVPPANP